MLSVPPSFFFEGLQSDAAAPGFSETTASFEVGLLSTTDGIQLARAFARIANPKVRRRLVDLVTELAAEEAAPPKG